jgi:thiol-disulfide isomerase/thioredoxin
MLHSCRVVILCAAVPVLLAQKPGFESIPAARTNALEFTTTIRDFEAVALDGRLWRRRNLTGSVTVIGIWSTTCGPCLKEHRELQALYDSSRSTRHLQVLTFAMDEDPARVRSYMAQKGYTFPVIVNGQLSVRLFTADGGIPKHFVIDREARISEPFQDWSLGRIFMEAERLARSQ